MMMTDTLENNDENKDKTELVNIDPQPAAISDEKDEDDDEDIYGPKISPEDLAGEPLSFLCGSEEELQNGITTIFHAAVPVAYWDKLGSEALQVYVRASVHDEESAHVDFDNMDWNNDNWDNIARELDKTGRLNDIKEACAIVVTENEPTGFSWEYNDGSYDHISGYDRSAEVVTITVSRPSAHEQVCARLEIKKWKGSFTKKLIERLIS